MNIEIQDVIGEARALGGDEWGQTILAHANEYHQKNAMLRTLERTKKYAEWVKAEAAEEEVLRKEYQARERDVALKELGAEEKDVKVNGNATVEGEIPSANGVKSKKKKNKK